MIQLALEIPTALLEALTPFTELDFALAHKVLEDEKYAEFYAAREEDRTLILDNSMHELGHPLPPAELLRAAHSCRADYVIAPDMLGQPARNLLWFFETRKALAEEFKTAVCLCGRTPEERRIFLQEVYEADMLCLPFREERVAWFLEQLPQWTRIHLLGVSTLEELSLWPVIADRYTQISFSVDTGKPLKAAMVGRHLDDGKSLRGIPISSKDLLGLSLFTPEQLRLMGENIYSLKLRLV